MLEFQAWVTRISEEFGYPVTVRDVGPADPQLGPSTQMAVFERLTS